MTTALSSTSSALSRFAADDGKVFAVPRTSFTAFRGWEQLPKLGLIAAIAGLRAIVSSDIVEYAADSLQFASDWIAAHGPNPHGLDLDEIAAINLYTKQNLVDDAKSFYRVMNQKFWSTKRKDIVPFFAYLRLFIPGVRKLPNACPQDLVRGFPNALDLELYKEGAKVCVRHRHVYETRRRRALLLQRGQLLRYRSTQFIYGI